MIAQSASDPVRLALPLSSPSSPLPPSPRSSSFNYDRTMADERVAIYPSIVAAGVRVLVYNGDADACVPLIDNAW